MIAMALTNKPHLLVSTERISTVSTVVMCKSMLYKVLDLSNHDKLYKHPELLIYSGLISVSHAKEFVQNHIIDIIVYGDFTKGVIVGANYPIYPESLTDVGRLGKSLVKHLETHNSCDHCLFMSFTGYEKDHINHYDILHNRKSCHKKIYSNRLLEKIRFDIRIIISIKMVDIGSRHCVFDENAYRKTANVNPSINICSNQQVITIPDKQLQDECYRLAYEFRVIMRMYERLIKKGMTMEDVDAIIDSEGWDAAVAEESKHYEEY